MKNGVYHIAIMIFLIFTLSVYIVGCAYNPASITINEPLTSFKYKKVEIDKLIKNRNLRMASIYLNKMISNNDHFFYAYLHLAVIGAMFGDKKRCTKYLSLSKSYIHSRQDKLEYLFYKIKINLINRQKGYFDSSMEIISKLKENGANVGRLNYYEGLLFFYHGDFSSALKFFKTVVKLNSSYKRYAKNAINKI